MVHHNRPILKYFVTVNETVIGMKVTTLIQMKSKNAKNPN